MIAKDCEATGIDLFHGAMPYLFTVCDEEFQQRWWEADVDPLTRIPSWNESDLREFEQTCDAHDIWVYQNAKFDIRMESNVGVKHPPDLWKRLRDTLVAGHLLASNHPHDLTSMMVEYCATNIQPWEDRLEEATKEALKVVKRKFPAWRLAKEGLPEMPSVKGGDKSKKGKGEEKGSRWKFDAWTPRALVKEAAHSLRFDLLPEHSQQPTVLKSTEDNDVDISRPGKWGNPFILGRNGDREECVRKYAAYVWSSSKLIAALPELFGKRLGCKGNCAPRLCHGHVLRSLCHPWRTVLAEYANTDSSSTMALWQVQERLLRQRGLWKIFLEKSKTTEVVADMEGYGATISKKRSHEQRAKNAEQKSEADDRMVAMAADLGCSLSLPKGASPNGSLREFCFDVLKLPRVYDPKAKTTDPTMGKLAAEEWLNLAPGIQLDFVQQMMLRAKRSTQIGYSESYERFWTTPSNSRLHGDARDEWKVLHGNLNPTGTVSLRFSHSNPNTANVSKQNIACFFCQGDGCDECDGRGTERWNLRRPFGPAPGREWWCYDFENIELRVPGYEAEERKMIELFERPNDPPYFGSYHLLNASIIFPDEFWPLADRKGAFKERYKDTQYQWTKNFGFAKQYNCGEKTGDRAAHKTGAFRAVQKELPAVAKLNQKYIQQANRFGYVETLPDKTVDPDHGYPLICARGDWGKVKETEPLCYHVSGTAMWCTIKAMNRTGPVLRKWRQGGFDAWPVLQVHDELVMDLPKGGNLANKPRALFLKKLMERGHDIGVPTPVSMSYHPESWAEGKAV